MVSFRIMIPRLFNAIRCSSLTKSNASSMRRLQSEDDKENGVLDKTSHEEEMMCTRVSRETCCKAHPVAMSRTRDQLAFLVGRRVAKFLDAEENKSSALFTMPDTRRVHASTCLGIQSQALQCPLRHIFNTPRMTGRQRGTPRGFKSIITRYPTLAPAIPYFARYCECRRTVKWQQRRRRAWQERSN